MFASLKQSALDIIFPPACRICGRDGDWLCQLCLAQIKPSRAVCPAANVDLLLNLGSYDRPILQRIIQELKYSGGRVLVQPVARTLADAWQPELTGAALIPVPLHPKRERHRGFNQSALIAKALGKLLQLKTSAAVIRTRYTRPQVELSEAERRTNVKHAFAIKPGLERLPKNGIIVDDVFTTGATASEVAGLLRSAGMERIIVLTIAKG